MGCDTKGFIATNKKDVFEVADAIYKFLGTRYSNHSLKHLKKVASVRAEFELYVPHGKGFRVHFLDGDDKRMLYVWFSCDCDYEEIYKGPKIFFNLGCWGKSDELMLGILESLKYLGDAYYQYNDCMDKEWKKI